MIIICVERLKIATTRRSMKRGKLEERKFVCKTETSLGNQAKIIQDKENKYAHTGKALHVRKNIKQGKTKTTCFSPQIPGLIHVLYIILIARLC